MKFQIKNLIIVLGCMIISAQIMMAGSKPKQPVQPTQQKYPALTAPRAAYIHQLTDRIEKTLTRKVSSSAEVETWTKDMKALIAELQKPTFAITPTLENQIQKLQNIVFVVERNPTVIEVGNAEKKANEIFKDLTEEDFNKENAEAPIKPIKILSDEDIQKAVDQIHQVTQAGKGLSGKELKKWQDNALLLLQGEGESEGYLVSGDKPIHKAAVELRKALEDSGLIVVGAKEGKLGQISMPKPTGITLEGAGKHEMLGDDDFSHFFTDEHFKKLVADGFIKESDLKELSDAQTKERETLAKLETELDKFAKTGPFSDTENALGAMAALEKAIRSANTGLIRNEFGKTWPYALILNKMKLIGQRIAKWDNDVNVLLKKNTDLFITSLMSAYDAKLKDIESIVQGKNEKAIKWQEKDLVVANKTSSDILDKLMAATELMSRNGNEKLLEQLFDRDFNEEQKQNLKTNVDRAIKTGLNGFLFTYTDFINEKCLKTANADDENQKNLLIRSALIASKLVNLSNFLLVIVFKPLFPHDNQPQRLQEKITELKANIEKKYNFKFEEEKKN